MGRGAGLCRCTPPIARAVARVERTSAAPLGRGPLGLVRFSRALRLQRVLIRIGSGIISTMKTAKTASALDRLVGALGECLTPDSARRILALKADRMLQVRVDYLVGRCREGLLTPQERAEYGDYVSFSTFVAILKSKARQLLAHPQGD